MYIYIAAPYISDPIRNVARALHFAQKILDEGDIPFCPHLCHFWNEVTPQEESYWLYYVSSWIRKCDVLIRLSGESSGADREVEIAKQLNIPVIYSDFDA